jgi:iduronate 2-sulfatase
MVEWKKIGAAADSAVCELYDYEKDPAETKNLADEQPQVVAELRALLAKQPEAKPQVAGDGKAAQGAPAAKPKQDRAKMFAQRDKDGDGRLSREEFLANQPDPDEAPKRFQAFDTDKDGVLSRDEFIGMGGKARQP